MPIRFHVFIIGQVQKVGFRYATKLKAHALHIAGWVKNRDDGTVEAVFEGEKDTVENMIHWCYSGSPGNVESVKHIEEKAEGLKEFEIKY
ncbi:acylphosphatase [Candidatus Roizmanbacteria bacterium]|nr:acylphosphatase [Candidatus Roizmanbacteria bacterium]